MRIIGGRFKGKKLKSFRGSAVRPTSDRAREALFNILSPKTMGATVLDLYAGSGAFGIEAISRGAKSAVFIDNAPQALSLIRHNLEQCNATGQSRIIDWNAAAGLDCLRSYSQVFDLVFMDPPYGHRLVPATMEHLHACGCMQPNATLLAEHSCKDRLQSFPDCFHRLDHRKYGRSCLSFFRYCPA